MRVFSPPSSRSTSGSSWWRGVSGITMGICWGYHGYMVE